MARWAMVAMMVTIGCTWCFTGTAWSQQRSPFPPPIAMAPSPTPPPMAPAGIPQGPPAGAARKPNLPGEVISSPEMSSYPYSPSPQPVLDSKLLLQQKAAEQAAQRARRLAALKWFGYSNSRPVAGVDCVHGDYAPSWTSNNPHYPFRWVGVGPAWVSALPAIPSAR